jgi:hypothetical protein
MVGRFLTIILCKLLRLRVYITELVEIVWTVMNLRLWCIPTLLRYRGEVLSMGLSSLRGFLSLRMNNRLPFDMLLVHTVSICRTQYLGYVQARVFTALQPAASDRYYSCSARSAV